MRSVEDPGTVGRICEAISGVNQFPDKIWIFGQTYNILVAP